MLIQVQNKMLLLDAVSYAEIDLPDIEGDDFLIKLSLIVDGQSLEMRGQEALTVWLAIQKLAEPLTSLVANGHPVRDPF